MKQILLALTIFSCLSYTTAFATDLVTTSSTTQQVTPPSITQPQNINFENCTKMYAVNKEKLFYLTLGAISANKFSVEEIQSTSGYIIFSGANNKFLATIASIDATNSILKITPCNDIYFFPPGVLIGMFKYIDLNLNTEIK